VGVSQFDKLRMQLEDSTPDAALIMITSAKSDDGSTVSAIALADTLAAAGYRVGLLARNLESTTAEPPFALHVLAEQPSARESTTDAVAVLAQKMRSMYDFTIIDAAPLVESRLSRLLAGVVHAVLISVRLGRSRCPEDDAMMQALERAEARVFGAIGASPASIRALEGANPSLPAAGKFYTRKNSPWSESIVAVP
jgi:Mrp family chromosome partitioning ATPase